MFLIFVHRKNVSGKYYLESENKIQGSIRKVLL